MRRVVCPQHGSQMVPDIAPVGPTFTRPSLPVIERVPWGGSLYGARDDCDHYITYGLGGGVRCVRCPGWFCA